LNGSGAQVAFDAPTKAWAARQNAPVVDLYLFDIRENLDRRQTAFENVRADDGRVLERRPPARRFALSYLITAWTQRAEDEHRLLSAMLSCFLRYDALPPEDLQGNLAEQPWPVPVSIALPPPDDRSVSELWSALGGELKPSLDLVIVAPFVSAKVMPAGPPVLEDPRFSFQAGPDGEPETAARGARRERVSAATPGAAQAGPSGGAEPEPGATRPDEPEPAAETVTSGTEEHPGRTIRIRRIP
jgi:hypothetical protein